MIKSRRKEGILRMDKFLFLEENDYFYNKDVQKKHTVYQFKEGEYRGIIGVPSNHTNHFWYKFFIKGDSQSYRFQQALEELPIWFQELASVAEEKINERDRIRKIFARQYEEKITKT